MALPRTADGARATGKEEENRRHRLLLAVVPKRSASTVGRSSAYAVLVKVAAADDAADRGIGTIGGVVCPLKVMLRQHRQIE